MRSGLFLFLLPCAFLVAVASFLSGCSQPSPRGGRSETMISPQPPPFLNGPVAVLLTNAHGFSAHVAMQTELGPSPEITSGQLLGRGDFLLFLPSYPEKWQKSLRAAGLSFLWNVGEGHGFVLSEALQAWAPMSSGYLATNVIVVATNPVPEKVDGRLCGAETETVVSSEGNAATFEVFRPLRTQGLPGGLPLRISAAPGAAPLLVSMTEVRLEAPAADLFQVPSGFTKYESAEAMLGELAIRQANLKHKEHQPTETEESSPMIHPKGTQ